MIDRQLDRQLATERYQTVHGLMNRIDFERATKRLPKELFLALQSVPQDRAAQVARPIAEIDRNGRSLIPGQAVPLGYYLLDVVSKEFLASVLDTPFPPRRVPVRPADGQPTAPRRGGTVLAAGAGGPVPEPHEPDLHMPRRPVIAACGCPAPVAVPCFCAVPRLRSFNQTNGGAVICCHLLPSFVSYLIVHLTLAVPNLILGETTLSFIGLGLKCARGELGRAADQCPEPPHRPLERSATACASPPTPTIDVRRGHEVFYV